MKMVYLIDLGTSFLLDHWLAFLVITFVSIFLYYWGIAPYRRSTIISAVGDLPGPKPLPFVGNTLEAMKALGHMHLLFDEYYKKYGRLFRMFIFTRTPSIAMSDPEMLKEVFVKEFNSFPNRSAPTNLPKPFDSMLSSASGATWHRIRSILSPTFSGFKMKVMVPLLNKSCDVLENKLDGATNTGETINIYKFFLDLCLESILRGFFSIESNAQMDENDIASIAASKAVQPVNPLRQILFFLLFSIPGGSYILKMFPSLAFANFIDLINLTTKIIETKRNQKDAKIKDFLDMMLSKCENEELPEDKKLTEDEVLAQSFVFLAAGYETVSNGLAFASYHLATNPEIQQRAQKEIDDIWVDEEQPLTYDMVQSMVYLEMVISESLRLFPPGVGVVRVASKDCVIKGLKIKKGTTVFALAYSMHRDPEFFPDPEKFDPERFSSEAKQSRNPYTYLPFGHGPRNCIGMRFAMFEMKLILARLLKKFTLVVAPETKIPPEVMLKTVLVCGKDGMPLRVQRRE